MNDLLAPTLGFTLLSFGSLLLVIIGFGFLIFVHELGHFLVAKWVGVRCPQFSIGFGTAICSWRRGIGLRFGSTEPEFEQRAKAWLEEQGVDLESATTKQINDAGDKLGLGETEYRLNYLPLGGYVKMVGQEDLDPSAASDDPRSFTRQKIWKRACILSAGVTMNMIFGMIFFIIAFMAGVEFPPAIVGMVVPGAPASQAYAQGHKNDPAYQGLQPGDKILTVNGKAVRDLNGVIIATALAAPDTPVKMTIKRPGQDEQLVYNIVPAKNEKLHRRAVGIIPPNNLNVIGIADDGVLAQQGVKTQMRVVKVNGKAIEHYRQFLQAVVHAQGAPVRATFMPYDESSGNLIRKAKPVHATVSAWPLLTAQDDQPANLLGLVPADGVAAVIPDEPAAKAGMKVGDVIARVGTIDWPTADQFAGATKAAMLQGVGVTVWRNGRLINLGKIKPNVKGHVGIILTQALNAPIVASTLPDSPAAALNLPAGSRIVSLAGHKVQSWADMQRVLSHWATTESDIAATAPAAGKGDAARHPLNGKKHSTSDILHSTSHAVPITYHLNIANQPIESSVITLNSEQVRQLAQAGWALTPTVAFGTLQIKVGSSNPITAAWIGLQKTKQFMIQTYISLLRLVQGAVSVKQLRGPVGIVQIGTQATSRGWEYLLYFLGVISVNLAVLNFLPLPVVDGGHIVFLIIEKIKGSPVNATIQIATMIVGLALIAGVMLMATYNDIARFFTG